VLRPTAGQGKADAVFVRLSNRHHQQDCLDAWSPFFFLLSSLATSIIAGMISILYSALLFLAATPSATAASDKPLKPCTIVSPTTERFFDLNPLQRLPPSEDGKKKKETEEGSWHARGYDYGANFTLNFCGPVVEELDKVQDLDKDLWRNVSAFYERDGKQWAIG
jgi:cation-dependent mannose-6-phosphate receptor